MGPVAVAVIVIVPVPVVVTGFVLTRPPNNIPANVPVVVFRFDAGIVGVAVPVIVNDPAPAVLLVTVPVIVTEPVPLVTRAVVLMYPANVTPANVVVFVARFVDGTAKPVTVNEPAPVDVTLLDPVIVSDPVPFVVMYLVRPLNVAVANA